MLCCLQQVGGLQQKVDEMEMTQRDIVTEYEEHVMHLKKEVIHVYRHSLCAGLTCGFLSQTQNSPYRLPLPPLLTVKRN